jgi:guanylate kinase
MPELESTSKHSPFLILSGPSGIGKDYRWVPAAKTLGFNPLTRTTTRLRRPDDDTDSYTFLTVPEFQSLIRTRALLEWDVFDNSYYGISNDSNFGGKIVYCKATMALRIKAKIPTAITILLLAENPDTISSRLTSKGFHNESLMTRLGQTFEEAIHEPLFDVAIRAAESMTHQEAVSSLSNAIEARSKINETINKI